MWAFWLTAKIKQNVTEENHKNLVWEKSNSWPQSSSEFDLPQQQKLDCDSSHDFEVDTSSKYYEVES